MINWYRVFDILEWRCEREVHDIKDALTHLYVERGLSLSTILEMSEREITSPLTVRNKLRSLGIKVRGKGGANNNKFIPLTPEEFKMNSARQLARKYDVDIVTVYNRKRKFRKEGLL